MSYYCLLFLFQSRVPCHLCFPSKMIILALWYQQDCNGVKGESRRVKKLLTQTKIMQEKKMYLCIFYKSSKNDRWIIGLICIYKHETSKLLWNFPSNIQRSKTICSYNFQHWGNQINTCSNTLIRNGSLRYLLKFDCKTYLN